MPFGYTDNIGADFIFQRQLDFRNAAFDGIDFVDFGYHVGDGAFEVVESGYHVGDGAFEVVESGYHVGDSAFEVVESGYHVSDGAFEVVESGYYAGDNVCKVIDVDQNQIKFLAVCYSIIPPFLLIVDFQYIMQGT